MVPIPIPSRLGRLCQATLRRPGTRAALSQRLHPPRRHLQPQTGRPRTGQRHLPLARLRACQQAAPADSAGRRVPAPLPAPPAATRLHAHPQLRLPRQPATRCPAAALLPVAPGLSRHLGSNCAARCGSSLLVYLLELSRLRRLYARRGTVLRNSTPAAFSTPHPLMCRMSPLSQPRSLRMLSHEHRPCVSKSRGTNKTTPTAIFARLKTTHIRIAQRCDQPTRPATTTPRSASLATTRYKIHKTHSGERLPSSRCIRIARTQLRRCKPSYAGDPDTALRHFGQFGRRPRHSISLGLPLRYIVKPVQY